VCSPKLGILSPWRETASPEMRHVRRVIRSAPAIGT
jgi:hypothetical protein